MTNKILGLDLGTNSIGWALIEVNENYTPIRIIALGSRIISLSADDSKEFKTGNTISKNKNRTTARTQRKGYDRKQLKKKYLKTILEKLDIYPTKELLKIPSVDLWQMRSDAASQNISAEQLGRILYMLNQKRGYKSARTEANQDRKDTEYVAEVKGRYAQLKEKNKTIGQHFYDELVIAKNDGTYFRTKEKVYPREAYIEEFDKIIEIQKKKHSFLTDEVINNLRNEIIYYQRKLKSQKGLVSVCEFEGFETTYIDKETLKEKKAFVGPKVAPKTSPLNQLCRVWEVVNNISLKIKNPEGSKYKWSDYYPTIEEKQKIAQYLNCNSNLSFSELIKILNLDTKNVFANKQIKNGIKGNETYTEIYNIVGDSEYLAFNFSIIPSKHNSVLVDKQTGEIIEENESLQINAIIEQEPFYQLWHTIYSIKDMDECKKALMKRFDFTDEIAEKLSKLDFNKQAFSSKSNKAMRKILPYLMQGRNLSDAENFAGYNRRLNNDERAKMVKDEPLKLLQKNSLRQPIVEKILNQMINVVNAIIEKYGRPSEIRVELARELKQSKDERNDADKNNKLNESINNEIIARLTELKLPTTKKYIQKYKFIFPIKDKKWKQAQVVNQCIYCGESFNLSEALIGEDFDVDHIIPKALLFDDSQTNKVLVHRKCNSTKTNLTAYDYIANKGELELNVYIERVDDWFKKGIISYGKMQRLKVSHKEYIERKKLKKETEADKKLWENFIDRQLRETAYISRKAKEILQQVCNKVTSTEGTITAELRKLWGWDDVLMNLQMEKYKAIGQTEWKEWTSDHGKKKHKKEEIQNWTKRDDHRHHAIDALVIACTQQGFIQRLNTLNSNDTKDAMQNEIDAAKKKYGTEYNEALLKETNEFVKEHYSRITKLQEYLINQRPSLFTTKYVENEADKILVSFKAGKKVATTGVRKVKINGKKTVVQKDIIIPRGALHEQSVYGKIKVIAKDIKTGGLIDFSIKYLFENVEDIVNIKIKNLVERRLQENENNVKKSIASLKKNPIYLDDKKENILEKANCYKEEIVIKYPIQNLKDKDVPYIVDEKIKSLVKARLDLHNGKEKEAFKTTLWFNEAKKIPILTVRCYTGLSAVETIKKDENGKEIGFAVLGNNHHIAIYKDNEGKLLQHSCTLWHAVERKKYKLPIIIKNTQQIWTDLINKDLSQSFLDNLPADNLELEFSMQQNEMFVLGMKQKDFELAIKENNIPLISKYLYLVWSLSDNNYWFRHHLETKNSDLKNTEGVKESKRLYNVRSIGALFNLNPIKIRINHLGEISKIGE